MNTPLPDEDVLIRSYYSGLTNSNPTQSGLTTSNPTPSGLTTSNPTQSGLSINNPTHTGLKNGITTEFQTQYS